MYMAVLSFIGLSEALSGSHIVVALIESWDGRLFLLKLVLDQLSVGLCQADNTLINVEAARKEYLLKAWIVRTYLGRGIHNFVCPQRCWGVGCDPATHRSVNYNLRRNHVGKHARQPGCLSFHRGESKSLMS